MALFLTDIHKSHLKFLQQHPPDVLVSYANAALEYISKGPNAKDYSSVAKKFNTSVEKIQRALESFAYILVECSKFDVNDEEFSKIFIEAGFTDEQAYSLVDLYSENKSAIAQIFEKTDNLSYFYDLKWRFESKISSRALLEQVTPLITLDLKLADSSHAATADKIDNVLLQTDPSTLTHITETLEKALQESRPHNIRKIERKIKKITLIDV